MASGPNLDEYRGRRLSPAEAQRVLEITGAAMRPTARELGVAYSTFRAWCYPEENRANFKRWYSENAEYLRAKRRQEYADRPQFERNRRLLKERHYKALARIRKRKGV